MRYRLTQHCYYLQKLASLAKNTKSKLGMEESEEKVRVNRLQREEGDEEVTKLNLSWGFNGVKGEEPEAGYPRYQRTSTQFRSLYAGS